MPTARDLAKLATELYGTHVGAESYVEGLIIDRSKVSSLGFTDSSFGVWSGEEDDRYYAYTRDFLSSTTDLVNDLRYLSINQAVCVGD